MVKELRSTEVCELTWIDLKDKLLREETKMWNIHPAQSHLKKKILFIYLGERERESKRERERKNKSRGRRSRLLTEEGAPCGLNPRPLRW